MDEEQTPRITRLGSEECWRLLDGTGVGALATAADDRPDVFPINYLVDGKTLVFRTAPGTKVAELAIAPHAAFIVQGRESDGYWSVVMRGLVEMLPDEVEVIGSGALELASWGAGSKRVFLRLTPSSVEGRRVQRADLDRAAFYN